MNHRSLILLLFPAVAALAPVRGAETPTTPPPADAAVQHYEPSRFLHAGEKLTFRLSWGLLTGAGEFTIHTFKEDSPEGPRLHVVTHLESRGIASAFYELDTNAESLIDLSNGRPLRIERTGKEGDRDVRATTVFNYKEGRVEHTDFGRPGRSGTAKLPEQRLYDLFVTLMQARTWNLKPGETRKVLASFEDDFYNLEATATRETTIKTPSGKYDTVEIEMVQKGELKGFFKKGGTMKFWISKGPHPQIVRIDGKAPIGTLVMALAKVEQPDPKATVAKD